jgi:tetratricopeptide (TPR) repeat protein
MDWWSLGQSNVSSNRRLERGPAPVAFASFLVLSLSAAAAGQELVPAPADMKVSATGEAPRLSPVSFSDTIPNAPALKGPPGEIGNIATHDKSRGGATDTQARMKRAEDGMRAGDYLSALVELDFVLAGEPTRLEAMWMRALCHLWRDPAGSAASLRDASADVNQMLILDPGDALAIAVRGAIAQKQRNYDQAIADLTYAIEHRAGPACASRGLKLHWYRATAFICKEEYAKGLDDLNAARSAEPGIELDGRFLTDRGNCHAACGHFDAAIADLSAAIAIRGGDDRAFWLRARSYWGKGDLNRALADYDEVVRHRADDATAYFERLSLLLSKGEKARVVADVDRLVELLPKEAGVYLYRSVISLVILKNWDKALADMDRSLALEPRCAFYYALRTVMHARKFDCAAVAKDLALIAASMNYNELKFYWKIDFEEERFSVWFTWTVKDAVPASRRVASSASKLERQCVDAATHCLWAATFGSSS